MEKLPPEKAAEMLRKKGMDVSVEQAALMLALLRMLAGIIVATYLEQGRYPLGARIGRPWAGREAGAVSPRKRVG